MAAPVFGATDVLTLGADWEPQGSDGSTTKQVAQASANDGDTIAETEHATTIAGTARYIYIGAETAFVAALSAAAAWPGQVLNSLYLVTGLALDYGPCAEGKRPVLTFSFRNGPTAAPATPFRYVTALVLPTFTAANVEVPDAILTATLGSAEIVNVQWGLTAQFGEVFDKDGAYLAGQCYKGEESLALTTVGVPTSFTSTGWMAPTGGASLNTSNTDYPQTTYNFTRKVTRSAIP